MSGSPCYYWSYLHLDQLLSAQEPLSDPPAHDELLFIVVHQAFELWFKQILCELDAVLAMMGQDVVAEKDMGEVVAQLQRITEIQRLLIDQIDVLETMTPLDFLEFRDLLVPASGFQSVQFRLIENKLGVDPGHRLRIKADAATPRVLSSEHAGRLEASEREPSLCDHVERWLERTPFLTFGGFDFWRAYRGAVDRDAGRASGRWSRTTPTRRRGAGGRSWPSSTAPMASFEAAVRRREVGRAASGPGSAACRHRAFLAALLINLYRDEPIFQLPFRFLTALVDIDEGFTAWRQRHALWPTG